MQHADIMGPMQRFHDEDFAGTEFRECDLSRARLIGVVMDGAEIDGLVSNLVVNGVEVMAYVEAELDRRYPLRVLLRSDDPVDLREGWRQLRRGWADAIERVRSMPEGSEHQRVNDEWSMVETLRHLVFVHDSWFRRCVLGLTEPFASIGIGPDSLPVTEGLNRSAQPTLAEVLDVRLRYASEMDAWLSDISPEQLALRAPVPNDDRWPTYAGGRSIRQCFGTILNEEFEHLRFCQRDLNTLVNP
jgi:uncharacterized protein YjbI with pentapeptide repeats